jgi:hypothetical protein
VDNNIYCALVLRACQAKLINSPILAEHLYTECDRAKLRELRTMTRKKNSFKLPRWILWVLMVTSLVIILAIPPMPSFMCQVNNIIESSVTASVITPENIPATHAFLISFSAVAISMVQI